MESEIEHGVCWCRPNPVFRCILVALMALAFATLAWGQDDEVEVEYAVKSVGDWQVPVKILQRMTTRRAMLPPADYQDGVEELPEDEPSNAIQWEVPAETYKLPKETRHFSRDLNLTREMLNSFGRRQLQSSSALAVNRDNFHPLCEIEQAMIEFQDKDYEYRPHYYLELSCKKSKSLQVDDSLAVHGKCALPLLHCVQIKHVLHIARRLKNSTCWEPQTVELKAGCECMWPEHELGNPNDHY